MLPPQRRRCQPNRNPFLMQFSVAESDPLLNLQNLSISTTSVSMSNITPIRTNPIVTVASGSDVHMTWATPRYQVASRIQSRQVRFDTVRELPGDLPVLSMGSGGNATAQTSVVNSVGSINASLVDSGSGARIPAVDSYPEQQPAYYRCAVSQQPSQCTASLPLVPR